MLKKDIAEGSVDCCFFSTGGEVIRSLYAVLNHLFFHNEKTKSSNLRTMELFVLLFDREIDSKKVRVVLSLEDMDMSELYNNATYN